MPPLFIFAIIFHDVKKIVCVFVYKMKHNMIFSIVISKRVAIWHNYVCEFYIHVAGGGVEPSPVFLFPHVRPYECLRCPARCRTRPSRVAAAFEVKCKLRFYNAFSNIFSELHADLFFCSYFVVCFWAPHQICIY